MSRVYDALQRSQGENPSASPLAHGQPESAPGETPGVAASAAVATGVAEDVYPPLQVVPAVVPTGSPTVTPTDGKWLNVPADRILHPHPTPEQRLVSIAEADSPGAEMFRVLSTRLAHMQRKRRLQKLLITSSEGDEGELIFLLNAGWMVAESDFNGRGWFPEGMHGYHPSDSYSDAVFLSNQKPLQPMRTIAAVYYSIRDAGREAKEKVAL